MEPQVVQRTNKVGVGVDVFCAHAGCVCIQKHSANLPSKASGRNNLPSKPHCRTPFFQKWDGSISLSLQLYMWCIYIYVYIIYVDLFQKMTISFCFQTFHPFGIWQPPKPTKTSRSTPKSRSSRKVKAHFTMSLASYNARAAACSRVAKTTSWKWEHTRLTILTWIDKGSIMINP